MLYELLEVKTYDDGETRYEVDGCNSLYVITNSSGTLLNHSLPVHVELVRHFPLVVYGDRDRQNSSSLSSLAKSMMNDKYEVYYKITKYNPKPQYNLDGTIKNPKNINIDSNGNYESPKDSHVYIVSCYCDTMAYYHCYTYKLNAIPSDRKDEYEEFAKKVTPILIRNDDKVTTFGPDNVSIDESFMWSKGDNVREIGNINKDGSFGENQLLFDGLTLHEVGGYHIFFRPTLCEIYNCLNGKYDFSKYSNIYVETNSAWNGSFECIIASADFQVGHTKIFVS